MTVGTEEEFLASVREAVLSARQALGRPADLPLRLVCAVSGGVDSTVMLDLLAELRKTDALELSVAHYDHALRAESLGEAEFVRSLAEKYGAAFYTKRAHDAPASENLEAWARRSRYEFLEQARQTCGADLIVTAHHQNDQAETLLFRLLSSRLCTSAYCIDRLDHKRRVLRPLLGAARSQIVHYAGKRGLGWVEDRSNMDTSRSRNSLRHELIPLLQRRFNPNAVSSLAGYAQRAAEDEDVLWKLAEATAWRPDFVLSRETLELLAPALRWRAILLHARQALGPRAKKLGYRVLKDIEQLILHERVPRGGIDLPFGIRVSSDAGGGVEFTELVPQDELTEPSLLTVPGEVYFPPLGVVRVRRLDRTAVSLDELPSLCRGNLKAFFSDELSTRPLVVRRRRDGDAMDVWKRGSRKLKKLFQEKQIAPPMRDMLPVIEAGDAVVWVPGVARGRLYPIVPGGLSVIELSFERR